MNKNNKSIHNLEKFLFLLKVLRKNCKGKECHKNFHNLVSFLDENSLKFLAECVRNSLSPDRVNILTKRKRARLLKKLKPYKKDIFEVIKPKTPNKRRQQILQKGSGWFLPLLSAVIPLITSLITRRQ